MRAHKLRDLALTGQHAVLTVLPEFDLYELGHVESLILRRAAGEDTFDLQIETTYEANPEYSVTLVFAGVHSAKLPALSPSFYVGEFEIEDVRGDQLEGIRYRARDFRGNGFEVNCQDIELHVAKS
jgi:hypothetical protein